MHQLSYQRELVKMGHDVTLCVDMLMLPERAKMGWQPENTDGISLYVGLTWEESRKVLEQSASDSIHFVSGIRGVQHGGRLTRLAAQLNRRVCWISETWDHRGWRGFLRGILYRGEAIYYKNIIEKIFAMGDLGATDYVAAGYRKNCVVPFNYVVSVESAFSASRPKIRPFVFGYVGSLIRRKRVDVLLNALASLPADSGEWIVEIHGDGPDRELLERITTHQQLRGRVHWCGKFISSDVAQRLSRLDAMVLPSDFDGWGAVVNEALLCGVPVVVSDACGAACLPRRHGWGRVFAAGDVQACAEACRSLMENPVTVDPQQVHAVIGPYATASILTKALL